MPAAAAVDHLAAIADASVPLSAPDLERRFLDLVGDAPLVLLGEATHGTHEFYAWRRRLTLLLARERGCTGVAIEGDWPDAARVDRFVRGAGHDRRAIDALADFRRFPQWMWRNLDALALLGDLRAHNEGLPEREHVGFYGLDLYSLHRSLDAVLAYLDRVAPDAAARARERYACFGRFDPDPRRYGMAVGQGLRRGCAEEAVAQLVEMRRLAAEETIRDGLGAADEAFAAEQNARLAVDAERYYSALFDGGVSTWNLRDRHMADTLDALLAHHRRTRGRARFVVWAHNSHLGDARATELARGGELNLGQLARERHGAEAVLVGFTTWAGTVAAAPAWGGAVQRKHLRPALRGSHEDLLHGVGGDFLLPIREAPAVAAALNEERLERMVGVVYLPLSERASHYVHARMGDQFDALIHVDTTRAVTPLEGSAGWDDGELPETYPSGV